ncbi:MAG: hypothetical protein EXX96DRAFT_580629 [Benjaminiella poitrasii]|nr:MAG: hypothetical protein EXX96DRAFT_580629 [Benjaminiella poitrasii]
MSNMSTSYFPSPSTTTPTTNTTTADSSNSNRTSPITHHVYPPYNSTNHRLSTHDYQNTYVMDCHHDLNHFTGSPISTPTTLGPNNNSSVTTTNMTVPPPLQYEFQAVVPPPTPSNQHPNQRFPTTTTTTENMSFFPNTFPHQTQPSYNTQCDMPSPTYIYTPPISTNISAPPTPTDPSITFQFDNTLHQRTMSDASTRSSHNNTNMFVANTIPYQQQQSIQPNGLDIYDF